jgi:hypothetical protein
MWEKILLALLTELENNPDRVFALIEKIVDLVRGNTAAQSAIIDIARARLIPPTK